MISLLIGLVIFCLIASLLWWLIQQFPLPQPVRLVVIVAFVLICILVLINYLPLGAIPRGRWG